MKNLSTVNIQMLVTIDCRCEQHALLITGAYLEAALVEPFSSSFGFFSLERKMCVSVHRLGYRYYLQCVLHTE